MLIHEAKVTSCDLASAGIRGGKGSCFSPQSTHQLPPWRKEELAVSQGDQGVLPLAYRLSLESEKIELGGAETPLLREQQAQALHPPWHPQDGPWWERGPCRVRGRTLSWWHWPLVILLACCCHCGRQRLPDHGWGGGIHGAQTWAQSRWHEPSDLVCSLVDAAPPSRPPLPCLLVNLMAPCATLPP